MGIKSPDAFLPGARILMLAKEFDNNKKATKRIISFFIRVVLVNRLVKIAK